jgi:hypothetical protein
VSIAAGRGFGHGVTDKTVANDTIQLDVVSGPAGTVRWDLIVCRRDWTPTGGLSKFEKVTGGATPVIPGGRLVGPGNQDDQPLALVPVISGQTQPGTIIDLRTWSGDGGGLIAKDNLVLSFLNSTGTRVHINGWDWIRRPGANDLPEWESFKTPQIAAGKVVVPLGTETVSATRSVTFPVAFAGEPVVTVSMNSNVAGPASRLNVSGYAESSTGFTAKVQTNDNVKIGTSYNITLNWIAVLP